MSFHTHIDTITMLTVPYISVCTCSCSLHMELNRHADMSAWISKHGQTHGGRKTPHTQRDICTKTHSHFHTYMHIQRSILTHTDKYTHR